MDDFIHRILRAMKLEAALFEEVEADESALVQAMFVVILESLASGIGGSGQKLTGLIGGTAISLISWFVWAYLIYIIGTKLLPESQTRSDIKEMLRVLGFASAPGILRILGVISPLRQIMLFVTTIWVIMATVVAVRQALDYKSTARAIIVCFIAWLVQAIILGFFLALMLKGQGIKQL